jgi:hypothetical protein
LRFFLSGTAGGGADGIAGFCTTQHVASKCMALQRSAPRCNAVPDLLRRWRGLFLVVVVHRADVAAAHDARKLLRKLHVRLAVTAADKAGRYRRG